MKSIKIVLLLCFVVTGFAQTKKPIVATDLMKIATASQIQISPDGNKAAMVVTRKAVKNENEYYYTRHLYLLDLTGKEEPTQLTFGDKNDSQPQWSPDDKQIAFVRTDGEKSQVWLLPMGGGEAHVLTKAEQGATNPRWSPDGKKILYSSSIPFYAIEGKTSWAYERPNRAQGDEPNFKNMKADEKKKINATPDGDLQDVRAWLAKNASENNPRVLNRQNIQGELNLQPDENFNHLFAMSIDGDEKAMQLTNGFQNFNNAEWSPDGKKIICDSKAYSVHPDKERDSDIWTIDVESKQAKQLLRWEGYSLSNPQFSPDGQSILFFANSTNGRFYSQSIISTASALGEKPMLLTAALDRDAGQSTWSADSKTIYFTAQEDGDIPLYSVPSKGGKISKLIGNDSGVNDFDVKGNHIVYALTETKNPWEVYDFSIKEKSNKQLTKLNEQWLKEREIIALKEFWTTRADGTKVQYWVMEPIGKKEGVKYPTILNIHGGPSAMWGPGNFSMWHEFQLENSWGYGVVYCNPRGSGGYGPWRELPRQLGC